MATKKKAAAKKAAPKKTVKKTAAKKKASRPKAVKKTAAKKPARRYGGGGGGGGGGRGRGPGDTFELGDYSRLGGIVQGVSPLVYRCPQGDYEVQRRAIPEHTLKCPYHGVALVRVD